MPGTKVLSIRIPEEVWEKAMSLPVEKRREAVELVLTALKLLEERRDRKGQVKETIKKIIGILKDHSKDVTNLLGTGYDVNIGTKAFTVTMKLYPTMDTYEVEIRDPHNDLVIRYRKDHGEEEFETRKYLPAPDEVMKILLTAVVESTKESLK